MISVQTDMMLRRHVDALLGGGHLIPEFPLQKDSYDELLRKLTLVHGRMWQLEDEISLHYTDDHYVAQIKRELDRCFKAIRPQLVERLNVLAVQAARGDVNADEFLTTCLKETLVSGERPVLGNVIPDSFGEIIERVCILKIRIWKLQRALERNAQEPDMQNLINSKLQQCIDVMLPRYLQALEQVWLRIIVEPHMPPEVSVKLYVGFGGSDV